MIRYLGKVAASTVVIFAVFVACRPNKVAEPLPVLPPTLMPQPSIVQRRVDYESVNANPRTATDSAFRIANQRADSAGALVDTLVASPTELRMTVGDSVLYFESIKVEARDKSGAIIRSAALAFAASQSRVVVIRRRYLVAVAAGKGELIVQVMKFRGTPGPRPKPITRVAVTVVKKP